MIESSVFSVCHLFYKSIIIYLLTNLMSSAHLGFQYAFFANKNLVSRSNINKSPT